MSTLQVKLHCRHPGFALEAAFELELGRVHAVLGPSGSGKTTLLRAIAGLDRGAHGQVHCGGDVWQDSERAIRLAVHRRRVSFVFQDARLFSHMNVESNVMYGRRRVKGIVNRFSPQEVMEAVGVWSLRKLRPARLSAGQRQRVAFAQAVLAEPRLLIMDEPFTALDDSARRDLVGWVRRLPGAGVTVLYVSHAAEEVMEVADDAVLLKAGGVVRVGELDRHVRDVGADYAQGYAVDKARPLSA